ncbi:hypothetical protein LX32DRAFT_179610 [Colletotrichum zoysiae]|uniref:Uncharacterized protein n=1 Tax=Colletotrichum zoysiae TaxID=1216348 RepID=A0AAD9HRF8_9PEZI|nr:hypothetical protein LX32DRAFT_179610 [Colletotrichum zoysiae]
MSSKNCSSSSKSSSISPSLLSSSTTSLEAIPEVASSRRPSKFSASSFHPFAPVSAEEKWESIFPGRGMPRALSRYTFTNRIVMVTSAPASWAFNVSFRSAGKKAD